MHIFAVSVVGVGGVVTHPLGDNKRNGVEVTEAALGRYGFHARDHGLIKPRAGQHGQDAGQHRHLVREDAAPQKTTR